MTGRSGSSGRSETLCPHVHLPLQSGSDRVLAAMGRGYTRGEYLAKIEALRQVRPGMAFSSDFIVGFPGETEDDFRETLAVMEEVRFDSSFSFRFSSRPGTRAAEMKEKVDPREAAERLRRLQELQAAHTRERLTARVGREGRRFSSKERARGTRGCVAAEPPATRW